MRTAIYGLFDEQGVCLYVGGTRNPKTREIGHRSSGRKFSSFKIFKWVHKKAKFVEGVYIRKYKALGQAALNVKTNITTSNPEIMTDMEIMRRIKALKLGETFVVKNASERSAAISFARILHSVEMIEHALSSRKNKDGSFTIWVVPE